MTVTPEEAALVAKLTEAIAEVQQALGVPRTRKLLRGLTDGLGAPEPNSVGGQSSAQEGR